MGELEVPWPCTVRLDRGPFPASLQHASHLYTFDSARDSFFNQYELVSLWLIELGDFYPYSIL
jgi:hypothetical protein